MTKFNTRSLQLILSAAALSVAGMAFAQSNDAPAADQAAVAAKPGPHKAKHHKANKGHRHNEHVARGSSNSKEAAAARQAEREGKLGGRNGDDQYQRNAVARCEVFKNEADKRSCAARILNGQASGSVQGGGLLLEHSEQVQMNR